MFQISHMITSWQERYRLLVFDEIDSTSSEAIRIVKNGVNENYVIWAKNQTDSRGRNNKQWYSSKGNLHVSILLNHQIDITYLQQLSIVMAVVVYKSLSFLARDTANIIKVKWPNDILINERKVSGVLLESIRINNNKNYLIIGVGINVKDHPINIDQLTTDLLTERVQVPSLEYLLDILMVNFEKYLNKWKQEGLNKIRQYWLKKAYKLGETLTFNDGNTKITGIFKDIDANGYIRIQLTSGQMQCINYV